MASSRLELIMNTAADAANNISSAMEQFRPGFVRSCITLLVNYGGTYFTLCFPHFFPIILVSLVLADTRLSKILTFIRTTISQLPTM